jgi:hypothetical protein
MDAAGNTRGANVNASNQLSVSLDGSSTTLPISAASLPLPSGAATAAKQPALGTAGSASADVISVQGIASMTALKVDGSAVTQPVSAASLPLPSGASTAAKQPALGTAGTASSDVITIQGIASMTAVKVDGSAVTQPVSNGGTFAVQATQSGSWNVGLNAGTNAIGKLAANSGVIIGQVETAVAAATTGTFTNGTQTTSITATSLAGYETVTVSINGTYGTATAVFEASDDAGTTWYGVQAARTNSATVESGYTTLTNTSQMWVAAINGANQFRVRSTAVASGTVNVRITPTAATIPAAATVQVAGTVTVSVSNTPSVSQSGTWTVATNADAAIGAGTAPAKALVVGAVYNSTEISPSTAQTFALQADSKGRLRGVIMDAAGNTRGANVNSSNQLSVSVDASTTLTVNSHAVTNAGTFAVQAAGDTASGASDAGNPVKIGGVGKTANPSAVTDGQRINALFDKLGKQIVVSAVRDLKGVQETTITSSTSETTIVTAVASTFLDVYSIILANSGASATKVTIKDSTAGTTCMVFYMPSGETRGFVVDPSGAVPQATVNNNWTATCSNSTASLDVTVLYVKNT